LHPFVISWYHYCVMKKMHIYHYALEVKKLNQWLFHNVVSTNGYIWQNGALTEIVDWSDNVTPQHVLINPLKTSKPAFLEFISVDSENNNNFLTFVREFGPLIPFSSTVASPKIPGIVNQVGEKPELESAFFLNHKNPEQTSNFYKLEQFDLKYAYDLAVSRENFLFIGYLFFEDVATPHTLAELAHLQKIHKQIFHNPILSPKKTTILLQQQVDIDDTNIAAIAEILRSNINWRLAVEPVTPFVRAEIFPLMTSPGEYFDDLFKKFFISAEDFNGSSKITLNTLVNIWLDKFITWNTSHYACEVRHHFDPIQNKWVPLIRPSSLLAAMWYQLTEWLAGHRKYRQCKGCGVWMDVTDKNSNNYYHADCANRLRVRKSRVKTAAIKLSNEGRTPQEIANALNWPEADIVSMLSEGSVSNGCKNRKKRGQ